MASPKSNLAKILDKIHAFNVGAHDDMLNPLSAVLKLLAEIRTLREGGGDKVTVGLHQLSDQIDLSRYSLRFLLAFSSLRSIIRGTYQDKDGDQVVTSLRYVQQILNILYSYHELQVYVRSIAPSLLHYSDTPYGRRSCQIWAISIILDLICMHRKGELSLDSLRVSRNSTLNFVANVCNLALAVHWSSTTSSLSPLQVAMLRTISGLIAFFMRWYGTAE